MSSTTYDTGSLAKTVTVILNKPSDWDEWLFIIKQKANAADVWQYVDPSLDQQPEQPAPPSRPLPSDVKDGALTILDLDPDEGQYLIMLREDYKIQDKEHQLCRKGLNDLDALICSTVSRNNLTYIMRDCDSPYSKLRALRKRLAPTDRARELELVGQYTALKRAPTSQELDTWLQQWEKVYNDAVAIGLPDVQGERPLFDFLEAVKSLDTSFSSTYLARIMSGEKVPTVFTLIEQFRNTQRIAQAADHNFTHSNSAFPTLQGKAGPSPPHECVCGRNHFYKDCYYLVEAKRPAHWTPNAKVLQTIQEKIASNPRLAAHVDRVRREALKRNSAKTDTVPPSEATNESPNAAMVGSFSAAHTATNKYELQDYWILDSGSNIHVCNNTGNYTPTRKATVNDRLYAGKAVYDIESFGTTRIDVRTPQGTRQIELLDTAYIPGFLTNLVALSKLTRKGVHWNTETQTLNRNGETVCYVQAYEGHWILNDREPPSAAYSTAYTAEPRPKRSLPASQWHQVLAHAGQAAVQHLPTATEGTAITIQDAPSTIECESCSLSKARRQVSRRPGQEEPAENPFERVSYDLIPMTEGYNGDRWVSHFRCYKTGMNHTYTHPHKGDANRVVQDYIKLVETHYSAKIRFIRLDGERTLGSAFTRLVQERGISAERTAPYTPAQNGNAERSGGVIITAARTMRIHAQLPENLWPEIVKAAGYLLNRTPTRAYGWKTPFELATGRQPNLAHLHPIGCKAYSLAHNIPRTQRLLPRAQIGYLVGYDSTNIYRVWLPTKKKVIRTRDVTFEDQIYYHPAAPDRTEQIRQSDVDVVETVGQTTATSQEDAAADPPMEADSDDSDTIIVQPPRTREIPDNSNHDDVSLPNTVFRLRIPSETPSAQDATILPTPEPTPSPQELVEDENPANHSANTAPRASEISADISDANVLSQGSGRATRRQAYTAALKTAPMTLGGYYSAFNAALTHSKTLDRLHRDELPPPPKSWGDMLRHPYTLGFRQAAHKEYESLVKRPAFTSVLHNTVRDKQVLPLLWVFTYKFDTDGYLDKFKARICVRGDLQSAEDDTYAATLAIRTFRALMAIAAAFDLDIVQLDAVNAFLNSDIDRDVYVEHPKGYEKPGYVLHLLRALYGLRRSPLLWYNDLTLALKQLGLQSVLGVNCLLTNQWLIVFFHVDDVLVLYNRQHQLQVNTFLKQLTERYEMRQLYTARFFLGIRILRDRPNRRLWLCQDSYIDKLATKFHIHDFGTRFPQTPMTTDELTPSSSQATPQEIYAYQQRVGSINFAAVSTRPDIAKACSKLSEFLQNPSPTHLAAANRVLGYLARTKTLAIRYSASSANTGKTLLCAADASFADHPDRKSSNGYLCMLFEGPIDWNATKQKTVTTSSTEAELLALSYATKELMGWDRFFKSIEFDTQEDLSIYSDNRQTIRLLTQDSVRLTTKLRHVDIHNHWLRQEVQQGRINIEWLPTSQMLADGLTKALPRQRFEAFVQQLNLEDIQDRLLR